ncbi:MAG TPA: O-antigen ligase family protein [Mycobacteriales bacterium]|nr:O-antigen ligase family protein [Mycobacteriales bacterium]
MTSVAATTASKRRFGRRERDWRKDTPRLRRSWPSWKPIALTAFFASSVFSTLQQGQVAAFSAIAGFLFIGFAMLAVRRPQFSVMGLVIWVPLQVPILAYAYKLGAPLILVKQLGYMKEYWEIAILYVALRGKREEHGWRRRSLDRLDMVAMIYIGLATIYLLLPMAFHGLLGGLTFSGRLDAYRLECVYVVAFLCIRRLQLDARFVNEVRNAVMFISVVLAGFAIWESTNSTGFNNFLTNTLGYPAFRFATTGFHYSNAANLLDPGNIGSVSFTRAGSLFNDPLTFAFFSLIPFGLALERLTSERVSPLALAAAGAAGASILLAETRSAVLGAGLAAFVAIAVASRGKPGRFRFFIVLAAAVVLMLPSASHSSLKARFEGVFTGTNRDADSQEHVNATRGALHDVLHHPIGRGLGANTTTGVRYHSTNQTTAEDSYLETGEELGLAGGALNLLMLCVLLLELRRRSKRGGVRGELAGGLWLGGLGLVLGGFFLQVWLELVTSLVFWVLAGVALSEPSDQRSDQALEAEAEQLALLASHGI